MCTDEGQSSSTLCIVANQTLKCGRTLDNSKFTTSFLKPTGASTNKRNNNNNTNNNTNNLRLFDCCHTAQSNTTNTHHAGQRYIQKG